MSEEEKKAEETTNTAEGVPRENLIVPVSNLDGDARSASIERLRN